MIILNEINNDIKYQIKLRTGNQIENDFLPIENDIAKCLNCSIQSACLILFIA